MRTVAVLLRSPRPVNPKFNQSAPRVGWVRILSEKYATHSDLRIF